MTQQPLAPGDPVQVGPFEVRGRWRTGEAGSVLAAVAPDGRPVDLVLLGPGPSTDAATRDRFAAAVERIARQRPGSVVGAAPAAPVPWVALPAGTTTRTSGSDLASVLLGTSLPAGPQAGVGEAARGPRFAPYWHGRTYIRPAPPLVPATDGPAASPAAASGSAASSTRRWWLIGIVVALLLLLLALLWLLLARDRNGAADPSGVPGITATPHATPDSGPTFVPTPTPSGSATGSPTAPPTDRPTAPSPGTGVSPSGPGVLGPGFGPQDDTYTVTLEGLAFSFEIPGSWGCMRSDDGAPGAAVRWLCMDEAWLLDDSGGVPPGGVVQQEPCPSGCSPDQWAALRQKDAPGVRWSQVDAATLVHEDVSLDGTGESRYLVRMSHVFAAGPGGAGKQPDTHVYVSLSVPVEMRQHAWNVVQSIRANTP